jgi:large subunit ribosomal protein L7Ae
MSYVKFKVPDKLQDQIKSALTTIAEAKDSKIRKGMNECTKSIERGQAKLVVMAEDVSPPEILYHVPLLCEEKKIPYAYLSSKKILGKAVNINVGSSAIAIDNVGSGNETILNDIIKQLEALKK